MVLKFCVFSVLLLSLLVLGCSSESVDFLNDSDDDFSENNSFLVATCPTTYKYLESVGFSDDLIVRTDSSAVALSLLNSGVVNAAFVGRNAYFNEVQNDFSKRVLFDRFVIISSAGESVSWDFLISREVFVFDDVEFPDLNLVFVNKSFLSSSSPSDFFLVSWDDFDSLFLSGFRLVNVYVGDEKVDVFRNPSFYYDSVHEEVVDLIVEKILEKN